MKITFAGGASEVTGANYILHVSAARYPYGPQQLNLDKWSYKLISIETGEILSSTYTQWVTDSVGKTMKNYYQLQP